MKTILRKPLYFAIVAMAALNFSSCRDTNPADPDPDMGMTTDSVGNKVDTINNNVSTKGADTELDGE